LDTIRGRAASVNVFPDATALVFAKSLTFGVFCQNMWGRARWHDRKESKAKSTGRSQRDLQVATT